MRVSKPWLCAMVVMTLFIWTNSLVPGEGSGSLSLAVVDNVRAALDCLGLPSGWVTNFIVRKGAHFTEYAVLGVLAARAFGLAGPPRGSGGALLTVCTVLVLVPALDETIQLFVPGRSGLLTDVLIDLSGAACGAAASCALARRQIRA